MADRYYLARFKNAQEFGVYEKALAEIKNGRKSKFLKSKTTNNV
jgi:uncharacterized protein (DUF1810 family)